MIEVIYHGHLGNNLFQYAAGRLLAEKMGCQLRCAPISGFPGTERAIDGEVFESNPVRFVGNDLDIDGLLAGRYHGRRIVLDGYFQRYEDLRGEFKKLREWFRLDHVKPLFEPGPNDLVINWRLGDFLTPRRPHWALSPRFIKSIAQSDRWSRIFVVTESPDHRYVDEIRKHLAVEVFHGDPLVDFETVRRASNILMSTSSFSWWAAVLSDAKRIFYPELYNWSPLTVFYPGTKIPSERLFPHDQKRFVKVPRSALLRTTMTAVRIPTYSRNILARHVAHWPLLLYNEHIARDRKN